MSSINLDRMNIFLSCHPQQSIIKIRNYSGLKLKCLSAQISGLGHRDDRTALRGAQNHTTLPSRTDSFTDRRLSLTLRDKTPRGMETQSARPSGCLPRTHPPHRHRQPLAATARRSGRGLALHSGSAGSLHKQRSRARGGMPKVKLKITGGFRTPAGAQAFCVVRSCLSTLKKQRHPLLTALQAAFSGADPLLALNI